MILKVMKYKDVKASQFLEYFAVIYLYKTEKLDKTYKFSDRNLDVIRLKKYSNIVISNIAKLAEKLNFDNPILVYQLLNVMFKNKYLEAPDIKYRDCHTDEFGRKDYNFFYTIGEALAFNTHGVCRHKSLLLKQCLDKLGIDSNLIIGYAISSKDINNRKSDGVPILGNHAIIKSLYEGKDAYLDLNLNSCYSKEKGELISQNNDVFLPNKSPILHKDHIDYRLGRDKHRTTSISEYKLNIEYANYVIKENIDLLEQFYVENVELLEKMEECFNNLVAYFQKNNRFYKENKKAKNVKKLLLNR